MKLRMIPLAFVPAIVALSACTPDGKADAPANSEEAAKTANSETIAAGLGQDSKFMAAAKTAGIDVTLAGPGPYTVLVPDDAAFDKLPAGRLDQLMKPESRAELTQILTYHILPGTVLADDIGKAIDAADDKKAELATMGGKTLTATRDGDKIVLTDLAGNKAVVSQADTTQSNGVIHHIDAVLIPG